MATGRSFLTRTFDAFIGAAAVAAAIEAKRTPNSRDLARLGINPETFRAINRRY